jgi:hypothetical protein
MVNTEDWSRLRACLFELVSGSSPDPFRLEKNTHIAISLLPHAYVSNRPNLLHPRYFILEHVSSIIHSDALFFESKYIQMLAVAALLPVHPIQGLFSSVCKNAKSCKRKDAKGILLI